MRKGRGQGPGVRGPDKTPRKSPYRPPPGRPPKNPGVTLTRVLRTVRIDTIDKRSQVGVLLKRIRADLIAHLGGPDVISTTEAMLVEQLAVKLVITTAVGEYLLKQDTLVAQDGLLPAVLDHDRLQRTLAQLLAQVGLERRAKPVPDLQSYLAAKATPAGAAS